MRTYMGKRREEREKEKKEKKKKKPQKLRDSWATRLKG